MKKNIILVVIAHSDDEAIGMGGTIKKHVDSGDIVHVISMTNGVGSRENVDFEEINDRKESAKLASEHLGFIWGPCFDFSDNEMDNYSLLTIVKCVEKVRDKLNPNIVYTHSGADLNIDHRIVANAVLTAFRPQPKEDCREIRLFEIPSSTDFGSDNITGRFTPNLYIDVQKTWESKVAALLAYATEMRDYPHTRSIKGIENLAKMRGNQVGLIMAEAFEVIRKVET